MFVGMSQSLKLSIPEVPEACPREVLKPAGEIRSPDVVPVGRHPVLGLAGVAVHADVIQGVRSTQPAAQHSSADIISSGQHSKYAPYVKSIKFSAGQLKNSEP